MYDDFVTLPRGLFEDLLDAAKEHIAENEWKRRGSDRTKAEMRKLDEMICDVERHIAKLRGRS